MGKVIHWELSKKLKFDYTNKWYMHNPESVLENEMHKFLWDFEIQTDLQIFAGQPDLIIINEKKKKKRKKKKRTYRIVNFAVPADHRVKFEECEKRDKYLNLAKELKKTVKHESDDYTIVIGALVTVTKGLLELSHCNRKIFLEGTFMVVTAGKKWFFGINTACWENNPFSAEATRRSKREFSSPVNFQTMCWFLSFAVPNS